MKALIIGDEPLACNELTYLLNEIGGFEEISEVKNVKETLEALLVSQYGIIFLNVNLMDENGIELGTKTRKMKESLAIIFATVHDQYTVQAFESNATDCILKPFDQKRIEWTVSRVRMTKAKDDNSANAAANDVSVNFDQSLPVGVNDKVHMLEQQSITGIGTYNGITTIHIASHRHKTVGPLNRYEKRSNPAYFIRIHRSHIINTRHIKEVQQWFNYTYMVILTNGIKMQVERSFVKDSKASTGLL